jgi:lia operon protein LiaG
MKTVALSIHRSTERRSALLMALAVAASLTLTALGVMVYLSLMAVTACAAPVAERYVLDGDKVEVSNLAGSVHVVPWHGATAEVILVRGGRDAARLRVSRVVRDGVTHLHVVYPERRIVYPSSRTHGSSTLTVGADGCLDRHKGSLFSGHRVTVSSRGRGMEAWADLEIRVPAGCTPSVRLGIGEIAARDLDGHVVLDIGSGPVRVEHTRGSLLVDTGSGAVTLDGHDGELSVDTGSGSVDVTDVRGTSARLDTGSGHVTCSGVAVDDLLVDTGSGGVDMDRVRSRTISVDTGSGAVRIGLDGAPRSLVVDTGSGGVDISAPPELSAVVDLESGSGGIQSDFTMSALRHSHGELHGTIGDGQGRIAVDTGSGGVSLRRR